MRVRCRSIPVLAGQTNEVIGSLTSTRLLLSLYAPKMVALFLYWSTILWLFLVMSTCRLVGVDFLPQSRVPKCHLCNLNFYINTPPKGPSSPLTVFIAPVLSRKCLLAPRTTYTYVSWFLNRLRPRSLVVELASLCELLHAAPDAQVVIECLDNPHRHRANGKDEIDEAWQADHVATAYGGLHHALDHIVGLQNGQHVWFPVG